MEEQSVCTKSFMNIAIALQGHIFQLSNYGNHCHEATTVVY